MTWLDYAWCIPLGILTVWGIAIIFILCTSPGIQNAQGLTMSDDQNTPTLRAMRVVEQLLREAEERANQLRFVLDVLRKEAGIADD